jgi:hypothetical protein
VIEARPSPQDLSQGSDLVASVCQRRLQYNDRLNFRFEEKATESMMLFGSVERRYLGYGVETVGALVLDL